MKSLLILAMVLLSCLANAQTACIPIDPGWTQFYSTGSIQYIAYNTSTKQMVVTFRTSPPSNRDFENVPLSIAQSMYSLTDPTAYFNANIAPSYPEGLLTSFQSDMCPILNSQSMAWLLTHPLAKPPTTNYLLSDNGIFLTSDSGQRLTKQ